MTKKLDLYVPTNIKIRTEFFPGYGMGELIKSAVVAAVAGFIALVSYSANGSATFPIVLLLASVAASVAVLMKDQYNMSVMDQLMNMIRFSRSQKIYYYKRLEEW